jgi:hypothetical protein
VGVKDSGVLDIVFLSRSRFTSTVGVGVVGSSDHFETGERDQGNMPGHAGQRRPTSKLSRTDGMRQQPSKFGPLVAVPIIKGKKAFSNPPFCHPLPADVSIIYASAFVPVLDSLESEKFRTQLHANR